MMPDNNPFLEGYVSQIRGNDDACPYEDGSAEAERWCRGFGGKPVAKQAAAKPAKKRECHFSLSAEGRRPFVEGYKSAILAIRFGSVTVCPYDGGTPEHERWWKGFREPVIAKTSMSKVAAKKPISIPMAEGRRPFVEGYRSMIMATRFNKSNACPYDEGTTEYERWTKGFRGRIPAKAMAERTVR
jgi:hypothetical protein